ncbi:TolC family protein [uncultured Alistipes sp.]|uniref:TolC family protein n=1 Tax=uncultured Alistipes sp. TaxID=538949 RepID=UPI0025F9114B|nr:TolC family protein [uncultured Alistipes sp.]
MARLTILLILIFGATAAHAQELESWTLERCIAHAMEHNIEIKQQELTAEDRRIRLADSKWAYAPTVTGTNSLNVSSGRVLDPTTYDFVENQTVTGNSSSVSANMTLFSGMRNYYTLKRSQLDLLASQLGVEKSRNDIRLAVTAYFLEVLCARENIKNAEQVLSSLKLQAGKTEKAVRAGKVTTADLLQIQAQTADAGNELLTARNIYDVARLNLCQLLELKDYTAFEARPVDAAAYVGALSAAELIAEAAQDLPQLQMAKIGIDQAKRELQIARSAYYPTISLGAAYGSSFSDARQKAFQNADGTYRYEAYPFFDQYRDNANKYLSVSLNVPIFGKFSTRKNVNRQKLAVRQAEYAHYTMQKQVTKEVTQALIDARTALEKYNSSQQYVEAAEEAARQIERKYNLGAATVVDYNTSVTTLVKARSQLLQAKYEYLLKTKVIEIYSGR